MTHTHSKGGTVLSAFAAVIIIAGMLVPSASAQAHWWWNPPAHAAETVTVTIAKYVDGAEATAESADDAAFPMTSSWQQPEGDEESGAYDLSPESDTPYVAVTSALEEGASYTTSETLDGDTVGASCEDGTPFALVGYTTGATKEEAEEGTPSDTAPEFSNLEEDQYVIVWNETCEDEDPEEPTTPTGSLNGEVTGGSSDPEPGELEVTAIEAEKTTAIANGTFGDGWRYVFSITVPEDEEDLSMKFSDWEHSGGEHMIPVAGNMRISSEQASSTDTVLLTAADTYSSPELHITGDLDAEEEGLQIEVLVEVAVPAGTYNGTYSTSYGVRSL
jgi:hypothetical protein